MSYSCQLATVVLIAKRNNNENNRHETLTASGEELSQLVADVGLLLQVAAVLRLALCFLELCGPITSRRHAEKPHIQQNQRRTTLKMVFLCQYLRLISRVELMIARC